jgi:hypothetical protein
MQDTEAALCRNSSAVVEMLRGFVMALCRCQWYLERVDLNLLFVCRFILSIIPTLHTLFDSVSICKLTLLDSIHMC